MTNNGPLPTKIVPIRSPFGTRYGFVLPCGGIQSFETRKDARAGLAEYLSQQRPR